MGIREQQKYLEYLKKCEKKLTARELEEFKMFLKRQKDDEDFDSVSMKRLRELYDKYYEKKDISKLDDLFKKS